MGCIQADVKIFPWKIRSDPKTKSYEKRTGARFLGHKLKGRKAENSTPSDILAAL
jgi:hypothetical protein